MTSPSPSDFLTFGRRIAIPALRILARNQPGSYSSRTIRPFSFSTGLRSDGKSTEHTKEHVVDRQKKERLDPQAANSASAMQEKQQHGHSNGGSESSATTQADQRNSTQRAKEEHPEAPDVVIGMQDERGGKGA